jgi:hypothetical protein
MTARIGRIVSSIALGALLTVAGCTSFYEIPIETPIQPKLDIAGFQRVLVAGFIAGGTEDVDANLETVRLLRSQLRTKAGLRVIEADVLPLQEIAKDQAKDFPEPPPPAPAPATEGADEHKETTSNGGSEADAADSDDQSQPLPEEIKEEKDLEAYERLFANTSYWKKLGEEFQNPLIVTGTVLFTPHQRSGFVTREQEVYDQFGRRRVIPTRTYMERKGFILRPKFVFIDGRTGATLYAESFREEVLYNAQQNTPALSSYFELMDRLVPTFLNTLSMQRVRGTRVLLK